MPCTIDILEAAARRYDALAASCPDESSAEVFRRKADEVRAVVDSVGAGGLTGCGD